MILIGICFGAAPAQIPLWAIGAAACALALGILTGGLRIIKTVGTGIYECARSTRSPPSSRPASSSWRVAGRRTGQREPDRQLVHHRRGLGRAL